jgi:hypothetical protein
MSEINCFDLCDILRIAFNYLCRLIQLNVYVMNDGSGDFYGCICR